MDLEGSKRPSERVSEVGDAGLREAAIMFSQYLGIKKGPDDRKPVPSEWGCDPGRLLLPVATEPMREVGEVSQMSKSHEMEPTVAQGMFVAI